jgi:FtsZ-interacting cell division protein ZipA
MDTLRWILLIFGIVLITGIYFSGRRRESQLVQRREPLFDQHDKLDRDEREEAGEVWVERVEDSVETDVETADEHDVVDFEELLADNPNIDIADTRAVQKTDKSDFSLLLEGELVVIHLLAQDGVTTGETLYPLAYELGFELGNDGIFHYRLAGYPFLLVNMFKPGTFPEEAEMFESRGVSLLLPLSKVRHAVEAFGDLMSIAYELKSLLNAQLLDMNRNSLTNQSIAFLEEEIRQYQIRQRA